ncbi:phytanoyl-CoA dioxygenase family protein [Paenibacillus sp. GCM10023252]|uniref:phytanoyl-CoA dioxygenase family protein n=1 Tax=Paenibacillus sp. GCM10023252 TaxID=3252649 RepID=UPI00361D7DAA
MNDQHNGGSLTKEQMEFYNREGYLLIDRLLTEEDMAPAKEAMNSKVSIIANDLLNAGLINDLLEDRPFQYRLAELFQDLTPDDFLKYGRGWRDRLPGYFHLMSNPKILDAVQSLIGSEIYANPVYNTRPKIPRVAAGAVPWHQDKSYWPDANSNPVITVWIPLVDANEENGCLHIKPRTHRKRLLEWHAEQYSGTGYTALREDQLGSTETVILPAAAGSAILFNDRCLHMSTLNQSDGVRWSVDLRYQPTDQDPMPNYGTGFLARSAVRPERVATLEDWLADREEHEAENRSVI